MCSTTFYFTSFHFIFIFTETEILCCILNQFVTDVTKFISGCMASLSAMVQLELPHVNILSKMDLVKNKRDIEKSVMFTLQKQILFCSLLERACLLSWLISLVLFF